jgi:hypothetical protein
MVGDRLAATFHIRPWRPDDARLLRAAAAHISLDTIASRFFVGAGVVPEAYLRHVAAAYPAKWNAVVAVSGSRLVGWAEFGRYDDDEYAADVPDGGCDGAAR